MTNLNTTPNPFGKHSFRDNAVDSAASQTYEFDIDGSVAASVENTATAKPKFGRRSFLTGFAGAALACMLAFGVQGAIIDPATAEATGSPSATQTVINTNDAAAAAEKPTNPQTEQHNERDLHIGAPFQLHWAPPSEEESLFAATSWRSASQAW